MSNDGHVVTAICCRMLSAITQVQSCPTPPELVSKLANSLTSVSWASPSTAAWMSCVMPWRAALRARVKNALRDLSSGSTAMGASFSAIAFWNLL
jgi:hypothetical protein